MRLNLILLVVALGACQPEVPIIQPDKAATKEPAIIGAKANCRANPSPKCEFILQKAALRERMDNWVIGQCLEQSTDQDSENCVREYFKTGFQATESSAVSCEVASSLAAQLICLTMGGESFDVAVRAGMQRAKTFDWHNWIASEKSAMVALRQQSAEACAQVDRRGNAHCTNRVLAGRLGLPDKDLALCAESSDQRNVEECLLEAHGLRYLESAIRRMKVPVLVRDDVALVVRPPQLPLIDPGASSATAL